MNQDYFLSFIMALRMPVTKNSSKTSNFQFFMCQTVRLSHKSGYNVKKNQKRANWSFFCTFDGLSYDVFTNTATQEID